MGGLALLMVTIIAFSGKNPPKPHASPAPPQSMSVIDPNAARIQEYRERIEEQTRKLQLEQARLDASKQALGLTGSTGATGVAGVNPASPLPPAYVQPSPSLAAPDALAAEKAKRAYDSLFASNIALTYRKDMAQPGSSVPDYRALALNPYAPYAPVPPWLGGPGLPLPLPTAPPPGAPPPAQAVAASPAQVALKNPAPKKDDAQLQKAEGGLHRLFEGTLIETVLTNRLDGTLSGPVNCMVTTPVYSHDGQHLLIPSGSRVLGEVHKVDTFGQERLAVAFHRLIMPDGYSLSLDQFRGLNQIGETGLKDLVNHHYAQIFGVSLAIGAIAGLAQANTNYGTTASAADAYRQGVAGSLSQSSLHILDRYLNVLPTFTIREGQRVKVILSDDLSLPAYENHRMPSDL